MTPEDASSLIGGPIDAVPTPGVVVDADALEHNLATLSSYFAERPCSIRPHFKSHKCVELARRQLAAGNATGITCAKVSEAEVLAAGGIDDILIANQVVGPDKARRLARLNRDATVRCAVDAVEQIDELSAAATEAGVIIPVLIEVDVGCHRCGVPPGEPALALAHRICSATGLRFDGLQGFEGHLIYVHDAAERLAQVRDSLASMVETRRTIEAAGIDVAIVSAGGSATYTATGNIEGIDEVQCGSYALMDAEYAKLTPEFKVASGVLATVISAHENYVVVDVGLKGLGCDFGLPIVDGHPEATARYTSEEHVPFDGMTGRVGDKIRVVPRHGCTTHALHRQMWIARDGVVEDVWAIEGAGCLE
jgi:D-serine deaminase-like pyridoxal phosphate-dependent protein